MNEQFFCITVPDYATPSFITAEKPCYGTEEDIRTVALANDKKLDVSDRPAELLYSEDIALDDYEWQHINIWDCTYRMKCQHVTARHFWICDGGAYLRCVKANFYGLMYEVALGRWTNVGDQIWGYPHLIEYVTEGRMHISTLAQTEKYSDTLEELKADHERFKNAPDLVFTEFCKDIFADG